MKSFGLWFFLVCSGMGLAESAQAGCSYGSQSSCWTVENTLGAPVTVRCQDDKGYLKGATWQVGAQGTYSQQFDVRWGDGMGFPEPGVHVTCHVVAPNGPAGYFDLTSLDWGDLVTIRIGRPGMQVNQRSAWSPSNSRTRTFPW